MVKDQPENKEAFLLLQKHKQDQIILWADKVRQRSLLRDNAASKIMVKYYDTTMPPAVEFKMRAGPLSAHGAARLKCVFEAKVNEQFFVFKINRNKKHQKLPLQRF
jgi:hypothetical protein